MRLFIITMCFLGCLPLHARKIAIVIGVGAYPSTSGLPRLVADQDTRTLKSALANAGWQVHLINCDNEEKPNMANILQAVGLIKDSLSGAYSLGNFSGLLEDIRPSDEVMLFFGGHGVTNREGVDCLVPFDAIYDKKTNKYSNEHTLISIEWIKRSLCRKGSFVMMIIDACRQDIITRSNEIGGKAKHTPTFDAPTRKAQVKEDPVFASYAETINDNNFVIIRSTQAGAYAHEQANAGVFTYFLIRMLSEYEIQEEADNEPSDGIISLGEALGYLKEQTKSWVSNLPNKKSEQIPEIQLSEQVDKERFFIEIETKRLSNPLHVFEFRAYNRKLPFEFYKTPVHTDPTEYISTYYRIAEDESGGKIMELDQPEDRYPKAELDFDDRFLATIGYTDANEFFYGLRPYEFYFPKEILNKTLNGKHRLNFNAIRFRPFKNAPINGYCTYTLEETTGEIDVKHKGRNKKFKVWKITQRLEGSNNDPCHPLNVQAFRTYYVLKNTADPVILETESFYRFYINETRIDPEMTNCRSVIKANVEYFHSRLNQISVQN
ncbi:MAG: caspase family protein [Saprospiraceae bacterium]|nr:caspase family protein [Saprospiraceae bacterium]